MIGKDHRAGRRHLPALGLSFSLVLALGVIEAVVAFATGSLSLLSDAVHMATDALGLGMALAAVVAADREVSRPGHTFGLYRLEILAALANAVLLFAVTGYVLTEAIGRLRDPVEVMSLPVLVVALGGLVVNGVAWRLLTKGAGESINIRGAHLEVKMDFLASIGVILAAVISLTTGWRYADPLIAILIGLIIVPRAWRLGAEALRILVQAAPPGLDPAKIHDSLIAVPGVDDAHDIHVWTLTSEMNVASAHLIISDEVDIHQVLDDARRVLEGQFDIDHATVQVEPRSHLQCSEAVW